MCVRTQSVAFVVRFPETRQKHTQTHSHVHADTRTYTDTRHTAGQRHTDRCGELRNPTVQGLSGECGRKLSRNDSQNVLEKHTHCVHVQFTLLLGRPGSPGSNPEGVAALDRGAETHTHTHTRTRILTLTHTHRHATYADPHAAIPRTHTHTHTHTWASTQKQHTPRRASQDLAQTQILCAHVCVRLWRRRGAMQRRMPCFPYVQPTRLSTEKVHTRVVCARVRA
jgi:hypothetical protein